MFQFTLAVNRPKNREPVNKTRAESLQLKRRTGYAYFVVNLNRIGEVTLGLGIRQYQNRITVQRTDENSMAAFAYLVGDAILDINKEKVTDIRMLQERLIDSLVKYGSVNTVVERAESAVVAYNTRMVPPYPRCIDPVMPDDAVYIAQRELVKHRATLKKKPPKSIYRHVEPAKHHGLLFDFLILILSVYFFYFSEQKIDSIVAAVPGEADVDKQPASKTSILPGNSRGASINPKPKVSFNLKINEVRIASDVSDFRTLKKVTG